MNRSIMVLLLLTITLQTLSGDIGFQDYKDTQKNLAEQQQFLRFMRALRDGNVKEARETIKPSFVSLSCNEKEIGEAPHYSYKDKHITPFALVLRNAGDRRNFREMLRLLKANGLDLQSSVVKVDGEYYTALPAAVNSGCRTLQDLQAAGMSVPFTELVNEVWYRPASERFGCYACFAMGRVRALFRR